MNRGTEWTTASFNFQQMAVHKRTTMLAHCYLKQNMWLCSKQSSFFPLMHCPLVANWKTRWSIEWNLQGLLCCFKGMFGWVVHLPSPYGVAPGCIQAFPLKSISSMVFSATQSCHIILESIWQDKQNHESGFLI